MKFAYVTHKVCDVLKLIPALLLIYISPIAMASSYESASRELSSMNDLLPDMEDLERQPRCEGNARTANSCGQYSTLDTCLDEGSNQGCFWAYY